MEQVSLTFKGKDVYSSDEKSSNIALTLYIDGVRQLSFFKGLAPEEIIDFLNILRTAPKERSEDDIVTMLWDRDFEHLNYFVPEELASGDVAGEEALVRELEVAAEQAAAGGGGAGGGGAGGASEMRAAAASAGAQLPPPSAEESEEVKQEAVNLKGDALIISAVDLLFDLMASESDISTLAEYSKNISASVELMLESGNLRGVMEILSRVRRFIDKAVEPEAKERLNGIIAGAGSAERINAVLGLTDDYQVLDEYLHLLNKNCIASLIEVLGTTEDRKFRRLICNFLISFVKDDLTPFRAAVGDRRWYLVRNVAMILGLSKEPGAVELIKKTVSHPDLRVRKEALKALASIHSPDTKPPLMALLRDSDLNVRMQALRVLRKIGGSDLYLAIMETVLKDDFKLKGFAEKKEYLEALGEVGGEKALPVLAGIFKKKTLFQRQENTEMRACAAHGLGYVRTPESMELLKGEADSKNDLLRGACLSALKVHGG